LDEYPEARVRYEEALPIYRAMGTRLGEANCIYSLGDVHHMLDEYPEARVRYEEALPIYRAMGARLGEANCIRSLGDISNEEEKITEAIDLYEQARSIFVSLGLPGRVAGVLNDLANLYDQQMNYPQAIRYYTEAIQSESKNALYYRNRACIYLKLRDFEHARPDIETAQRIQPDHPYLFLRFGDLYFLQGDYTEAIRWFNLSLQIKPELNIALFGLGRCALFQGQQDEGHLYYQQGLDLTNSKKELRDELLELNQLIVEHPDLASSLQAVYSLLGNWHSAK
jgi:tetratricopeptide (TPR) repeat protein